MREHWDAHPYGSIELEWPQALYLQILRPALAGKRVLELGCGTGTLSAELASTASHVTAVDFSEAMLRIARDRFGHVPNLEFVAADLRELALDGRFDVVCGVMVLHEVPQADYPALIESLKRHMAAESFGWFQENSFFNPGFRLFRRNLVGRHGIPKMGSYDETPFDAPRMKALCRAFRFCARSAESFALFRLINTYIIRSTAWERPLDKLDRRISTGPLPQVVRRNLSYLQHIYFSDSGVRSTFFERR